MANYNVWLTFIFRVCDGIATGIWSSSVLSNFISVSQGDDDQSNEKVGLAQAVQGTFLVAAALPAAWLTRRFRRDAILRGMGFVSYAAIATMTTALLSFSGPQQYWVLCGALALWGCAQANAPVLDALFADSVPTGKRAALYTWLHISYILSQGLGPAVAALLFYLRGEEWSVARMRLVMVAGMVLALVPATLLLCFNDDKALGEESEGLLKMLHRNKLSPGRPSHEVGLHQPLLLESPRQDEEGGGGAWYSDDERDLEGFNTPTVTHSPLTGQDMLTQQQQQQQQAAAGAVESNNNSPRPATPTRNTNHTNHASRTATNVEAEVVAEGSSPASRAEEEEGYVDPESHAIDLSEDAQTVYSSHMSSSSPYGSPHQADHAGLAGAPHAAGAPAVPGVLPLGAMPHGPSRLSRLQDALGTAAATISPAAAAADAAPTAGAAAAAAPVGSSHSLHGTGSHTTTVVTTGSGSASTAGQPPQPTRRSSSGSSGGQPDGGPPVPLHLQPVQEEYAAGDVSFTHGADEDQLLLSDGSVLMMHPSIVQHQGGPIAASTTSLDLWLPPTGRSGLMSLASSGGSTRGLLSGSTRPHSPQVPPSHGLVYALPNAGSSGSLSLRMSDSMGGASSVVGHVGSAATMTLHPDNDNLATDGGAGVAGVDPTSSSVDLQPPGLLQSSLESPTASAARGSPFSHVKDRNAEQQGGAMLSGPGRAGASPISHPPSRFAATAAELAQAGALPAVGSSMPSGAHTSTSAGRAAPGGGVRASPAASGTNGRVPASPPHSIKRAGTAGQSAVQQAGSPHESGGAAPQEDNTLPHARRKQGWGSPQAWDEGRHKRRQLLGSCWCLGPRAIPGILACTDMVMGLASGMTIKFFPIFFRQQVRLSPVAVNLMYCGVPLTLSLAAAIAQRQAQVIGKVPTMVLNRAIGITLLYWIATHVEAWQQPGLIIPIYLIRTSIMNANYPIQRSILMDFVPKEQRAFWASLESVTSFGWSGSAALGGFLIHKCGFQITFLVTAAMQAVGWAVSLLLLPIVPCYDVTAADLAQLRAVNSRASGTGRRQT